MPHPNTTDQKSPFLFPSLVVLSLPGPVSVNNLLPVPPVSNTFLSHPHLIPQQICQLIYKINPEATPDAPTLPATRPPSFFIWGRAPPDITLYTP